MLQRAAAVLSNEVPTSTQVKKINNILKMAKYSFFSLELLGSWVQLKGNRSLHRLRMLLSSADVDPLTTYWPGPSVLAVPTCVPGKRKDVFTVFKRYPVSVDHLEISSHSTAYVHIFKTCVHGEIAVRTVICPPCGLANDLPLFGQ